MEREVDKSSILHICEILAEGMIEKDDETLNLALADDFKLVHMTGMRQSKDEFIQYIQNGTLNYYSIQNKGVDIQELTGQSASLVSKSVISAAVFGSDRRNWKLMQKMKLRKADGVWKITESIVSPYFL